MKKALFLIFGIIISATRLHAQDLLISGGNSVSTIICANGSLYTWGTNQAGPVGGAVTGILGTGNTASMVSTPEPVIFPTNDPYFNVDLMTNITIKAVDAGSGSHFIALDCKGGAWSWGNNRFGTNNGITGTGSTAIALTTPTRVLRGEAPASSISSLSNFLVDVAYISGGNDNSYVIMNDGRAMGWGNNAKGQLGNGTLVNSPTPVYVRVPGGQHLRNVIQIEAGDETAYALVDPDGDGIGTVYSWGAGTGQFGGTGMLGRNANGTANNGEEVANDNYARPVLKRDGTPLDNIIMISAGDVMCLAIDIDGYVWAWGNGGWGDMTGQGAGVGNHSDPRRVVAGEWGTTPGDGMGEAFLKAKVVSAGQGFGMAVTTDGKPVAWGNNGATATSGGNLGDGGTTGSSSPKFIRVNATTVHSNVVSISDGDTWGFYTTSDNRIYTWGANNVGQLGIGNTNRQAFAVEFTLPPCKFPDPKPSAMLSPRDHLVCSLKWSLNGSLLNSGFVIAPALKNKYQIDWYRNGSRVSTGDGANTTYVAKEIGTYRVEVKYVGTDAPCEPYEMAFDEITISEFVQDFTVPTDLTYCGNSISPYVDGNGKYHWFVSPTATARIGSSIKNDLVVIPTSTPGLNKVGDKYTVYVEEVGGVHGNVGSPDAEPCLTKSDMDNPINSHTQIRVLDQKVTIDTVTIYHKGEYLGSTKAYNWQVCVYGTRMSNGKPHADRTKEQFCGPVVSLNSHDDANGYQALKIPVNITLEGSESGIDYWIGFKTGSRTAYYTCENTFPLRDDVVDGDFLTAISTDEYGNPQDKPKRGLFANIKFTTSQRFCERVPVELTEKCPCLTPDDIIIAQGDTARMCAGTPSVNLTTNTQANTSDFAFQWYKGSISTANKVGIAGNGVNTLPLTVDFEDGNAWYYVQVYDKGQDPLSTSCKKVDSIFVMSVDLEAEITTAGTDLEYCEGENGVTLTAKSAGTGASYQWYLDGAPLGAARATNTLANALKGTYKVNVLKEGCEEESETVVVIENPAPAVEIITAGSALEYCAGVPGVTLTASATIAAPGSISSYQWNGPVSGTSNPLANATAGDYDVLVSSDKGCEVVSDKVTVKLVDKIVPSVSLVQAPSPACEGSEVKVYAMAGGGGMDPTFTWTLNGAPITPAHKDTLVIASPVNNTPVTVRLESDLACADPKIADASLDLVVEPRPDVATITSGKGVSTCSQIGRLTNAFIAGGSTGRWFLRPGDIANLTPDDNSVIITGMQAGRTIRVYWEVRSGLACTANIDSADITRYPEVTEPDPGPDQTICESVTGFKLTGNTPKTGETAEWTATGPASIAADGTVSGLVPGENIFTYSISIGGECRKQKQVVVTVDRDVQMPTATPDTIYICNNEANLSASDPFPVGTGTWTKISGLGSISAANNSKTQVTGITAPGISVFNWSVKNGVCPAKEVRQVVSKLDDFSSVVDIELDTAAATFRSVNGKDVEICRGSTYNFRIRGADLDLATEEFLWRVDDPSVVELVPGTSRTPSFNVKGVGQTMIYYVIAKKQATCAQTAYFTVVVTDVPTRPTGLIGPTTVCAGVSTEVYSVDAVPGLSYDWTLPAGASIVGAANGPSVQISFGESMTAGNVNISVRARNKCGVSTDAATMPVRVNVRPNAQITGANVFCPGGSTTLQALPNDPATYTYMWFRDGDMLMNATPSLTVNESARYTVRVSIHNGCYNEASMDVREYERSLSIVSSTGEFKKCEDDDIILTLQTNGVIPSSYAWYIDGADQNRNNNTITAWEPGAYKAVILIGAGSGVFCKDSAEVVVEDLKRPEPEINEASVIKCEGEEYLISTTPTTNTTSFEWFRNGVRIPGATQSTYNATQTGNYTVVEKQAHYCQTMSDPLTLTFDRRPIANAGPDIYIRLGEAAMLDGSRSLHGYNHTWTVEDDPSWIEKAVQTVVAPTELRTQYYITIESENNVCTSTDSMIVVVELPVKVWNSLSPNGDGIFDHWEIENLYTYPNCLVEVYNRWGTLVWKSTGYNVPWRGENFRNGQELPVATYYYIIYPNGGAVKEPFSGHVTIIK